MPQGGKAEGRFEADGGVCDLAIPARDGAPPSTPAPSPGSEFARQVREAAAEG